MKNSIYNGDTGLIGGFQGAGGVVLCGYPQNDEKRDTAQAVIGDLDPVTLTPCTPVVIKNDSNPANGFGVLQGLNSKNFVVEKTAGDADKIDGFVLESSANVVDEDGNAGVPLAQGFVNLGLAGSRTEVFLPCDDTLIGVALTTSLAWNSANKCLTVGDGTKLSAQLLSSVVKGKVRKLVNGGVVWEDTNCVMVRL